MVLVSRAALAQGTGFASITDFGDSYADTGGAPGGLFRRLGMPCPASGTCRFSDNTNFVDTLQAVYDLPPATNYAIGGAPTSYTTLPPSPIVLSLAGQVAEFKASGGSFGRRDLVAMAIGINDIDQLSPSETISDIQGDAKASADSVANSITGVVARGAYNIAMVSPGNWNYLTAPFPSPAPPPLSVAQKDAWAGAYYQRLQQSLAPLARSGTRIFLFDYTTLLSDVTKYPGVYGFVRANSCWNAIGFGGCIHATSAVQNTYFLYDGIHPTSAGFALIARYVANQIDAPLTVAPQGHLALATALAFSRRVIGRLGLGRETNQDSRRWLLFASVGYGGGRGAAQTFASGYDYRSFGGMVGLEYRRGRSFRTGLALDIPPRAYV